MPALETVADQIRWGSGDSRSLRAFADAWPRARTIREPDEFHLIFHT